MTGSPAIVAPLRAGLATRAAVVTGAYVCAAAVVLLTLILLRGKAFNLGLFTSYESPADADWIRALTVRWVEELQRLNAR